MWHCNALYYVLLIVTEFYPALVVPARGVNPPRSPSSSISRQLNCRHFFVHFVQIVLGHLYYCLKFPHFLKKNPTFICTVHKKAVLLSGIILMFNHISLYLMNKVSLLIALFLSLSIPHTIADQWTNTELQSANTAAEVNYMTSLEKDVILYVNLARLYPQKFAKIEVENYTGPKGFSTHESFAANKSSLLVELQNRQGINALIPDYEMYNSAQCWANEMSETGAKGHNRTYCEKIFMGECCQYGVHVAREIVLQWLVDAGVESLGHRKICLSNKYDKAGVSHATHPNWNYCTVLDVR